MAEERAPGITAKDVGALAGITVIDMTRVVAGPMAAQTLADLGADVIKIERRGSGEDLRSLGPPWVKDQNGADTEQSSYFQAVNRGKRSVTLDFTRPEGGEILRRLVAKADVLLENMRTGTLGRYGLGYDDLAKINPRLIYCSITGFGQTGPYSDRSGYDYLLQAMGGQMAITGHPDGHPGDGPMRVGGPIADISAGNNAVTGILAALIQREKTGRGQHVDIALFDSQVAIILNAMSAWLNGKTKMPRTGNDHPTAVPNGVFPTSDGYILIATFNDREFARFAEAMDHPEWASDPRYMRSRDRYTNQRALIDEISAVLKTAGKAHWIAHLNAAKISCGPINDMADIEADPQIAARDMIVSMPHPQFGAVRFVGSPLKLSNMRIEYKRPPPLPGEHTDQVLAEQLGMTAQEIADLRKSEII
jgi:crotonobetainyl-CoA:carnitine CoA-transferase CaiB-like acyl-CoA transferase